jgi:uncharacterized membrane protein YphA (DoxX/SURF4 family)
MDLALWIIQVVLALAFLAFGGSHVFRFDDLAGAPRTGWVRAVGKANLRVIGVLEILGAIGLVLPAATGILPWLTPLAAAMLALLMVFAIAFHARRPGEAQNIVLNVVLGVLSLAVAWGRFVVESF